MRAQVSAQEKNGDSAEVSPGGVRGTELFQLRHWLADGTNNTALSSSRRQHQRFVGLFSCRSEPNVTGHNRY